MSCVRSRFLLLVVLGMALFAGPRDAFATPSRDACTGFLAHTAQNPPGTLAIDQPGVWCLDEDLTYDGVLFGSNFYLVRVRASDVTIDCRGHKLVFAGQLENYYYSHAIIVDEGHLRTTVRNCRIDNFSYAIFVGYVSEYARQQYLIEDNVVTRNGLDRIGFGGSVAAIYGFRDGTIRRNRIYDSAGWGIFAGTHATVTDNLVDGLVDIPDAPAVGIMIYQPSEVMVRGNVVRGLRHDPGIAPQSLYGMQVDAIYGLKVRLAIQDNVLVGDGDPATIGIDCTAGAGRVSDNVVAGFATFQAGCVDLGDNDITP